MLPVLPALNVIIQGKSTCYNFGCFSSNGGSTAGLHGPKWIVIFEEIPGSFNGIQSNFPTTAGTEICIWKVP